MSTVELDALYAEPKESWFRRYGKRIAGGLACSFVVAIMMKLPFIWAVVLWICHLVTVVCGKPPGAEKIERLEQGIERAYEKGKDFAKEHHGMMPKLTPVPEAVKDIKEQFDKAKGVAAEIKEGASIAKKGLDVAEAAKKKLDDAAQSIGDGLKAIPDKISDLTHSRSEAKDKKDYEALRVHATVVLGMKVDPDWSLVELRARVLKVELERAAKTAKNAQCPICHFGMRFSRDARGQRRCPRCANIIPVKSALALGPPAPPRTMHVFGR